VRPLSDMYSDSPSPSPPTRQGFSFGWRVRDIRSIACGGKESGWIGRQADSAGLLTFVAQLAVPTVILLSSIRRVRRLPIGRHHMRIPALIRAWPFDGSIDERSTSWSRSWVRLEAIITNLLLVTTSCRLATVMGGNSSCAAGEDVLEIRFDDAFHLYLPRILSY
jgi:hypothetical protein